MALELNLPPRMEARPRISGGFSYRVKLTDGRAVSLGRNLDDALTAYRELMPASQHGSDLARELWARHRRGAAARKLAFDLSVEDIARMLEQQRHRCAVTQKAFNNEKPAGSRIRPWAASIDRRDSTAGYSAGNCRIVCAFVNVAMNRFGDTLFLELLEGMVRKIVREEMLAILSKSTR